MSENLALYEAFREVPKEARKPIEAGRLKGKTDINPMWRIKALTEKFGPCGLGWKYTIEKQWIERGANEEIAAFCNILLYYKMDGQWSDGIPGNGGSAFVAKESKGPYTSDECYKMALTDAISVACKALGVAADVYWSGDTPDGSKYEKRDDLAFHSALAIGRRIEEKVTRLYKDGDGMAYRDIYAALNMNQKAFEQYMGMAKRLDVFERALNAL